MDIHRQFVATSTEGGDEGPKLGIPNLTLVGGTFKSIDGSLVDMQGCALWLCLFIFG